MDGYLLDTNIISYWFDENCAQHALVAGHIRALGEPPLLVSAVTLGEWEFGLQVAETPSNLARQSVARSFAEQRFPAVLNVARPTMLCYGRLRASLFEKYAPREKRTKAARLEQLFDPLSALQLGIQENDLWIASQALEHNLILVSNDKHMRRLRELDPSLRLENWAAASSP